MNFKKVLFSLSIVCFLGACGNKECHHEQGTKTENKAQVQNFTYECPMHCEGSQKNEPGKCPKCGMDIKEVKK
jgi:hypothetical protein